MKNTIWYYNVKLKPQGPFSYEQIRAMIFRGQIGPDDLVFEETEQAWKPAQLWRCFELQLFPANQGHKSELQGANQDKESNTEAKDAHKKDWVLVQDVRGKPTQNGPYSITEIKKMICKGEIALETLAWKPGLSGWSQLKERPEFKDLGERPL